MFTCRIEKKSETPTSWTFSILVKADKGTFLYEVEVDKEYHHTLVGSQIPANKLVEQTFFFLAEREPFSDILSEFNLREVQKYFPEFEQEIVKQL